MMSQDPNRKGYVVRIGNVLVFISEKEVRYIYKLMLVKSYIPEFRGVARGKFVGVDDNTYTVLTHEVVGTDEDLTMHTRAITFVFGEIPSFMALWVDEVYPELYTFEQFDKMELHPKTIEKALFVAWRIFPLPAPVTT